MTRMGAMPLVDHAEWRERHFRALRSDKDTRFGLDHLRAEPSSLPVWKAAVFPGVRHRGHLDRRHIRSRRCDRRMLEEYPRECPLRDGQPDALPPQALATCRTLHAGAGVPWGAR